MDLSKLSDSDLNALSSGDMSALSDAGLAVLGGPPAPATDRQKLQASVPMRIVQGGRDAIDAGAQLLPRGLQQVTSAFGYAPNKVSEYFGNEAKSVDQGISQNERDYEAARKATGSNGFDAARLVGNFISPANAAVAARVPAATGVLGRVASGAMTGAAGAAFQPVDTEKTPNFASQKLSQTAVGAIAGGLLSPVVGAIGDSAGRLMNKFSRSSEDDIQSGAQKLAADFGMDWQKATQAEKDQLVGLSKKALEETKNLDPAAVARLRDFKAEDMQGTLGQVTRDPRQFASERNLRTLPGTGDPLLERFAGQGRQLQSKVGNFANGADEVSNAGSSLIEGLRQYDDTLRKQVSGAYQTAKNSAGKDAELPLEGLAQSFAQTVDDFGDKVPSGVRNQFVKYGIAPGGDMTQRKLYTVEEADKLLKVINANQSNDPATNAALSQLRNAVKSSVTAEGGVEDVFTPARKLAAERFKLQEVVPALEASANGGANPNNFVDKFIVSKSAQPSQVQEMAKLLKQGDGSNFDQAKSQIGAYLQRAAYGENQAGDKAFKAESYAKALRNLGTDKLSAFYSPAEVDQLQRLGRIGAYIESVPNAAPVNNSNNWGAITNLATKLPVVGGMVGLANAAKTAVGNQTAVSNALAAKAPSSAQLTPQQIQMISRLLSGGTAASGSAAASELK